MVEGFFGVPPHVPIIIERGHAVMKSKEQWLTEAVYRLKPIFNNVGAPVGDIRIEVTNSIKALGTCSSNNVIQIHEELNSRSVFPVLLHEMLHAAVGVSEGHRGRFISVGQRIGLWADPSQPKTRYGEVSWPLAQLVRQLEMLLGPYPKS